MIMQDRLPAAAGLAALTVLFAAAAQAESPVSYTTQQAQRGLQAYTQACRDCHGANLDDGEFGGAPIRGSYFDQRFGGGPASALFGYIQTAMPPDRPGQLSLGTYADITAYLLERNGYPAGSAPLPTDLGALDEMTLTK
jgi:mono/diheme cytochrome c family protein